MHLLNMADEISIFFTKNSLKWYHNIIKHDYAFIDATGLLYRGVESCKRFLYYAITVRHLFPGKPPLPVAEYITSHYSKDFQFFFHFS